MSSDIAFNLTLPFTEFQTYICEDIMTAQFNPFVDDEGNIEILYKYGEYKNGKSLIKFRVPGLDKTFGVRYSGSSAFAMWWCGLTDEKEDMVEDLDNAFTELGKKDEPRTIQPEVIYDKAAGIDKTDKMGRPDFFSIMAQRESARKEAKKCDGCGGSGTVAPTPSGKKLCDGCDSHFSTM
jgi:hypothetical protein